MSTGDRLKNRYIVQWSLRKGRFGIPLVVNDIADAANQNLKVAKKIPIENFDSSDLRTVISEADLQSKLLHPNVVTYFGCFCEHDFFYLLTEFCEGGDLKKLISDQKAVGRSFSEDTILKLFAQLIRAVGYIHSQNVIHRDISPQNIFLTKNDVLKVGDFGCSKLLRNAIDTAQTFAGTPLYMSPEMLNLQDYTSKTDIWSSGCVLYELCVLDTLFAVQGIISLSIEVYNRGLPHLPRHFSHDLDNIFQSMTTKDPESRANAGDILRAPIVVKHSAATSNSFRRRRRRRLRQHSGESLSNSSTFSMSSRIDTETWDWFNLLDIDKSGALSSNEIRIALFNSSGEPFDEKAMKVFFELFDVNSDDTFDVKEFAEILQFIRQKQKEFDAVTADHLGGMDALILLDAVHKYLGYELSTDTIRLTIDKIGHSGFLQSGGYLLATAFYKLCDEKRSSSTSSPRDSFDTYVRSALNMF